MLAKHPEGFTIGREMKGGELFGWEVCDLAACGTVEWLQPEIVDSIIADIVEEGFPVWSVERAAETRGLGWRKTNLGFGALVERDEGDALLVGIFRGAGRSDEDSQPLVIRGEPVAEVTVNGMRND